MRGKERIEGYLREKGVRFEIHHHPLAYTAQRVAQSEHLPGRMVSKVVAAFADERMVLLAVPAPSYVDLAKATLALKAKEIRLATEDEVTVVFSDCDVGAMSPLGHLYNVPVYLDSALSEQERIVFNAGTHTDTISMTLEDYVRVANPVVADIARRS